MKKKGIYLVVHNVRSILNVGSLSVRRWAGVEKIYLCVIRRPRSASGKNSQDGFGAEKSVPWEYDARAAESYKS